MRLVGRKICEELFQCNYNTGPKPICSYWMPTRNEGDERWVRIIVTISVVFRNLYS